MEPIDDANVPVGQAQVAGIVWTNTLAEAENAPANEPFSHVFVLYNNTGVLYEVLCCESEFFRHTQLCRHHTEHLLAMVRR